MGVRRSFPAVLAFLLVAICAPAYASSGYFVTKVTGISPAFPGVSASANSGGGDITVLNEGPTPIVIDGYSGEPFVRIESDGVWQNQNSPAVYLDQSSTIGDVPSTAGANLPVKWVKLDTQPKYTWHDHRIHWMSDALPTVAQQDPGHAHLIKSWTIPISVGTAKGVIAGTLTYEPSGHLTTYITWGAIGFVVIGFLYIQFVLQPRRMRAAVAAAKEDSTPQP